MCDWQKAQDFLLEWEAKESEPKPAQEPVTIHLAGERFIADAEAQKLSGSSVYKYRLLVKQLEDFAEKRGLGYLVELELTMLDDFRSGWKDGPRSSAKKLERLRSFFRFA